MCFTTFNKIEFLLFQLAFDIPPILAENQMRWVTSVLKLMDKHKAKMFQVTHEAQSKYMKEFQTNFDRYFWADCKVGCWIANKEGRVTLLAPFHSYQYEKMTSKVIENHVGLQ